MGEVKQQQVLTWEGGFHSSKTGLPEKWHPATVPGAVQLDYAAAQNWGPFFYAERWKDYLWMEDVYWTYRTRFEKPEMAAGKKLFFVSKGIDYEFEILLNGEKIFYQEGMFSPVHIDLTNLLKQSNELQVKIYPAPKLPGFNMDRNQAAQSVKPALVMAGTGTHDWCPWASGMKLFLKSGMKHLQMIFLRVTS
jgi:beta-mannosidase